jgi:hypothetical protein
MEEEERYRSVDLAYEYVDLAQQLAAMFPPGYRRDLIPPFADQPDESGYHERWTEGDAATRSTCARAIREWLSIGALPELDDATVWYLCRRFEAASKFLMRLCVKGEETRFAYLGTPAELVEWLLIDWWMNHGAMDTFLEDLESQGFQ